MKIAVTGATGFIGRHALDALSGSPHEIVALLRPSTRLPERYASRVRPVFYDLHSPADGAYALLGRPDALIHLAWSGLPNYRSLHHFETELPLQFRFLSALVREGLPRLVATGTCFEYGMQSGALKEDAVPKPDNPYGMAKDALRRQLQFLQRETPFDLVWARLFYMYGAGQAANSLLPQLQAAVARGDATFGMSGGEQLRDYLPVEKVAHHLAELAQIKGDAGIVNICSGKPISVRRLVEDWLRTQGAEIKLDLGRYPYPDYEPMAFWGDANYLLRYSKGVART